MSRTPINQALAENLAYYMKKLGLVQQTLAMKCGVAQTTISNYLHPERRKAGRDGKPGSAKLSEVEMLADVLGVEPWELLRPMSDSQRLAYAQIEAAFKTLSTDVVPQPSDKSIKLSAIQNQRAQENA